MTKFESGKNADRRVSIPYDEAMRLGAKRKGPDHIKLGGRYYEVDESVVLHNDGEDYYGFREVTEEEYRAKRAKTRRELARAARKSAKDLFTGKTAERMRAERQQEREERAARMGHASWEAAMNMGAHPKRGDVVKLDGKYYVPTETYEDADGNEDVMGFRPVSKEEAKARMSGKSRGEEEQ